MSTEDYERFAALLGVARAAKALRSWDAIGALTSGDMPHAEDAQNDLRRLDDALDDAMRRGALGPAVQSAPAPPAPAREGVWLTAFGAAVALQVSRECNRGLNAVEAFDPAAGGTLRVEGVADHASAVAEMAVRAFLEWALPDLAEKGCMDGAER